jgi:hypothetical protein
VELAAALAVQAASSPTAGAAWAARGHRTGRYRRRRDSGTADWRSADCEAPVGHRRLPPVVRSASQTGFSNTLPGQCAD